MLYILTSGNNITCSLISKSKLIFLSKINILQGDHDQALALFDHEVSVRAANSGAMLDVVDVCSLLYRLQMEGWSSACFCGY